MRWEYYKDNICTDFPVAAGFNDSGVQICEVKESRNAYFTSPCNVYLESAYLTYTDARKMNSDEEERQETVDVLFSSMKHACEYFESDFKKQKEKIIRELF